MVTAVGRGGSGKQAREFSVVVTLLSRKADSYLDLWVRWRRRWGSCVTPWQRRVHVPGPPVPAWPGSGSERVAAFPPSGSPWPGPGASPRGTQSTAWTPALEAGGFSAGFGSTAFQIPWDHDAYIKPLQPRLPAQSTRGWQAPLCLEDTQQGFSSSSGRAAFSGSNSGR